MYDELVKSLRICGRMENIDDNCIAFHDGCCEAEPLCMYELMRQAADAIEELSERIATYEEAESDGRMIILPVKEGTPLYVDGKIFAAHCKGEIHEVKDWYYSFPMIYKDFRGEHDYVIDPDSIGNSVFLTRREAEENLEKEKS